MPAETSQTDYAFYGPMGGRPPRKRVFAASACALLGIAGIFTPALLLNTASYTDATIVVGSGVTLDGPSVPADLALELTASMRELETVPAPEPRAVTDDAVRSIPQTPTQSTASRAVTGPDVPSSPPAHGSGTAAEPGRPLQPNPGQPNTGKGDGNEDGKGDSTRSSGHGKGQLKTSKPATPHGGTHGRSDPAGRH